MAIKNEIPSACGNGYQGLASAIVLRAVRDYEEAWQRLTRAIEAERKGQNRDADIWSAENKLFEIRLFFFSGWFTLLTTVDPNYLIETIENGRL